MLSTNFRYQKLKYFNILPVTTSSPRCGVAENKNHEWPFFRRWVRGPVPQPRCCACHVSECLLAVIRSQSLANAPGGRSKNVQDNPIFRNFQDEDLPPAVLRAIGSRLMLDAKTVQGQERYFDNKSSQPAAVVGKKQQEVKVGSRSYEARGSAPTALLFCSTSPLARSSRSQF